MTLWMVDGDRAVVLVLAFAIQFALIYVLGNATGNITWGLQTAGPAFIWPWLLGGVLQLSVALSLGKVFSVDPQAGGCYAFLRRLPHRFLASFVGFLLLAGYVAAIADDNSGLATTALTIAGVAGPSAGQVAIIAILCLAVQTILCLFSIRVAARGIAVVVAVGIVGIIGIVLGLTMVGLRQGPALFLNATGTAAHEHLPPLLLMLLIPGWTITGLDVLGNLAGDITNPAHTVPRGLMSAALAAFLCGTALIIVPLLAMSSLAETAAAPSALMFIVQRRLGPGAGVFFNALDLTALFALPVVLQLAAARLLWAQVRDGTRPTARWLSQRTWHGVPARATLLCAAVAAVFCLTWPVLYALGTVWPALWALAYGITIAAALSANWKGMLPDARRWRLLAWSRAIDVLAACWSITFVVIALLFDAAHAVPLFGLIVIVGLLSQLPRIIPSDNWPGGVAQKSG